MRILTALTYYRPHYSGLTIYAERLAMSLVQRGHHVTVLTSRYNPSMLPNEVLDGVHIVRPRVRFHISKGVLMPSMPYWAYKLVRKADVVHLHLPQLDAALIALIAKLQGKPIIVTYHCDLLLPRGFINFLANLASDIANHVTLSLAAKIITNTQDYAENSAFLRRYLTKVQAIFTPVEVSSATQGDIEAFRQKTNIQPGDRIISMVGRLATEKGVEYLAQALPIIMERYPKARVLYAGQYQAVWGEQEYARRLSPLIEKLGDHWQFLGIISDMEKSALYQVSDIVAVPSLNSTESFSITQVEAMISGTPVVASDLPGVRQPVLLTGMGKLVQPGNTLALAQAIQEILEQPGQVRSQKMNLNQAFAPDTIAALYEAAFEEIVSHAR